MPYPRRTKEQEAEFQKLMELCGLHIRRKYQRRKWISYHRHQIKREKDRTPKRLWSWEDVLHGHP
jgi:hypothetical protein